jgi:PIN domain nuclease of toxin-antitoxin system
MTLLLDTHAFLWWINGEPIPARAADILSAREQIKPRRDADRFMPVLTCGQL